MSNKKINATARPNIWQTVCGIDDGLLPFICGATISTGLSTMLESSFDWNRFISGLSMFLASAFVFWWYVSLSKTKREIAANATGDEARFLTDKQVWEKYHNPKKILMRLLVSLAVVFIVIWGIFLYFSYSNSASVDNISNAVSQIMNTVHGKSLLYGRSL